MEPLILIEEYVNYIHFIPQVQFTDSQRDYYLGICPRDALVELLEFQLNNGWDIKEEESTTSLFNGSVVIFIDSFELDSFLKDVLYGKTFVSLKYKEFAGL